MKKTAILAACLSIVAFEASAISRYNTQTMTCGSVQSAVDSDGAAILRYGSKQSGMTLFDRYVAHAGYCGHQERAAVVSVPAKDAAYCPVLKCIPYEPEDLF